MGTGGGHWMPSIDGGKYGVDGEWNHLFARRRRWRLSIVLSFTDNPGA